MRIRASRKLDLADTPPLCIEAQLLQLVRYLFRVAQKDLGAQRC